MALKAAACPAGGHQCLLGMLGWRQSPRGAGMWVPIPARGSISSCREALAGTG